MDDFCAQLRTLAVDLDAEKEGGDGDEVWTLRQPNGTSATRGCARKATSTVAPVDGDGTDGTGIQAKGRGKATVDLYARFYALPRTLVVAAHTICSAILLCRPFVCFPYTLHSGKS